MRRILFMALAAVALCVAVPTLALAHNDHRSHHKRHHRVSHEFFKAHRHDRSGNSGSSTRATEPTAGTVTSFANRVLTITLNNGSTVSGAVTSNSEIKCDNAAMHNRDNDAGDDHGDAVLRHGDGGGDDRDNADRGDNDNNQTCIPTPGMAVRNAELTVNGNGAFWNEVELVNSTTSTTTSQS